MSSQKRVTKVCDQKLSPLKRTDKIKELGELTSSPPAGMSVQLADDNNLYEWKVVMDGPAGSPYAVSPLHEYLLESPRHLSQSSAVLVSTLPALTGSITSPLTPIQLIF
jgi:Ubiquitin-conjugating enzyme